MKASCIVNDPGEADVTTSHGFEFKTSMGRGNVATFRSSKERCIDNLASCLQSRLQDAQSEVVAATMVVDFNQWPLEAEGFSGIHFQENKTFQSNLLIKVIGRNKICFELNILDFGDDEIHILVEYFTPILEKAGFEVVDIETEWNTLKTGIYQTISYEFLFETLSS